jgi:hypothetical protein
MLDAIEGVAYLTDRAGTILAVGRRGWTSFAADNAAPWLTADAVVGTSLFAAIHGDAARDAYRRMHAAVAAGRRVETVFEYRCDSPIAERHMRMAITGVQGDAGTPGVVGVLYQSQIVATVPRLPLPLFEGAARRPQPAPPPDQMVALCSFCQRVAWPPGVDERPRRWISVVEYYRRGGPSELAVSDGICPGCLNRVVAPNV